MVGPNRPPKSPAFGGAFSNVVATLALVVSLATAGWSAYAFWKSSEVRVLEFTDATFFSQDGVPQINIEVTLANLPYGDFDDVAWRQDLFLDTPRGTLHFEAKRLSSLSLLLRNPDRSYPAPAPPCYAGGLGLAVCPVAEVPVTSLPAGQIVTITPVFELAEDDCGVADCDGATFAQIAPMLEGDVTVRYGVTTLRDGVKWHLCRLTINRAKIDYLLQVGWTNPACTKD